MPELFAAAGLGEIASTVEDEVTRTILWPHVIETLGPQMVAEVALSEVDRVAALAALSAYCGEQTLVLRAVTGVR